MTSETDKLLPPRAAAVSGGQLAQDQELDRSVRELIVLVSNCENALRSTLQSQISEKHPRSLQDSAKELVRMARQDE